MPSTNNLEPRPAVFDVFNIPPEDRITEIWEYKTDILEAQDGTEQRIQVRNRPRIKLQFALNTLNMDERAERVQHLYFALQRASLMPLFQYATPIKTNITRIFEVDYTNAFLKWEDYVVIYNYASRKFMYGRFNAYGEDQHKPGTTTITIQPDNFWDWENNKIGNNLTTAQTEFLNNSHNVIMPAVTCTINDGLKFATGERLTTFNFNCSSLYSSDVLAYDAPNQRVSVLTGGGALLDKTQLAPGDFALNFKREVIDNTTGIPFVDSNQLHPKVSGRVTFNIIDRADFHFWRYFIDRIKGGQKSFWLPSQVDDFEIIPQNPQPANSFNFKRFSRYSSTFMALLTAGRELGLLLYLTHGDVILFNQIAVFNVNDDVGRVTSGTINDLDNNPPVRASVVYKVRAGDNFTFTHYANYSTISFSVHGTKD